MQLFGFTPKLPRFRFQILLRGGNHADNPKCPLRKLALGFVIRI
jgi:hypothetical protein